MENILRLVKNTLEDKKANEVTIIDIRELSCMADYFIIASGSNINQVHAMSDFVEEELQKNNMKPSHIEGYRNANWILMDYGDFIIHIFDEESREFYDLERIWKGGKVLDI